MKRTKVKWRNKFLAGLIFSGVFVSGSGAQTIPDPNEFQEMMENNVTEETAASEDDSYLLQLEDYRKHPVNLNRADAGDLSVFPFLSGLQIDHFLVYRKQLGKLVSLYELQGIPYWDIGTIKKLFPYISLSTDTPPGTLIKNAFKKGNSSFLFRVTEALEKADGYTSTGDNRYRGSRDHLLIRYRYKFKNELQYGITADKDAGEQLKQGFDFYSFHFFIRNKGRIKSLALGDYTVNMGQGLIQWQGFSFGKGADISSVKKSGELIKPYSSAGEFYFNRGIGLTIQFRRFEWSVFSSWRNLSGNMIFDSLGKPAAVSSIQTSGYHRNASELADRNNLWQFSAGETLKYKRDRWHIALNAAWFRYSMPIIKPDAPYNLYNLPSDQWVNAGIDYAYTLKNIHFFGETAIDRHFNKATINGLLASVDPKVDLTILYRSISERYQSVNGHAFTENTFPVNEKGIYMGVLIRVLQSLQLSAYADVFRFPWLKYQADAPSYGKDFMIQLTYTPDKKTTVYSRFRTGCRQANDNRDEFSPSMPILDEVWRQSWRTHFSYELPGGIMLRQRVEAGWYRIMHGLPESGFLSYTDLLYRPAQKKWSAGMRLQYFQTDGYDTRIYAYENDVLYNFNIYSAFDKGWRYYLNLRAGVSANISISLKVSQTLYTEKQAVGSGLDEIPGRQRTDFNCQVNVIL